MTNLRNAEVVIIPYNRSYNSTCLINCNKPCESPAHEHCKWPSTHTAVSRLDQLCLPQPHSLHPNFDSFLHI